MNTTTDNSWWREVEYSRAGRMALVAPPAVARLCRETAWRLETPRRQVGYVRMWNARGIDLRYLFFGALAFPIIAPHEGGHERDTDDDEDEEEAVNSDPSQSDELARRLGLALQAPPTVMLRAAGPLAWPDALFPFQQDGIHALLESPRLLLGDEMGLGKSIQTIAALRILAHRREIERALIVMPASLIEQWRREVAKWAPELRAIIITGSPPERRWQWRYRAHITLVSYETLRADWVEGAPHGPGRVLWDAVALDEAQRIKNASSEIARVCKKLPRRRSWALTGTPLENRAEDVASILEFVTGAARSDRLLRPALDRYQLRRRKADVLQDLPPKLTTDLVLPLSASQRCAYERAAGEGVAELAQASQIKGEEQLGHALAVITRLKQLCNFEPSSGASAKLDDLQERLEEVTSAGHKSLVFTQFTDATFGARRIAARLDKFAPLLYTGKTDAARRAQIIDRFNSEARHRVLILSLRAGGQGLNLQNASYVFHFDRWWNPAVEQQAEDRIHRLGQTNAVHVYRYIMQDTIEQRIEEVLLNKRHLFDRLVDGATLDISRLLSRADLLELVQP